MKTSITKLFTFEASHKLPNHLGKCANLHGHSYQLQVTVTGDVQPNDGSPSEGMVMDFSDMSVIVDRAVLTPFDHQYLNDVVDYVTTAENLAADIFTRLESAGLPVSRVKLWETRKNFVTVEK